jgi:hypothetical protein
MSNQFSKSPADCCDQYQAMYQFQMAKSIPSLGPKLQLFRTECHGYNLVFRCQECGTFWREVSTPAGQFDRYETSRIGIEDDVKPRFSIRSNF